MDKTERPQLKLDLEGASDQLAELARLYNENKARFVGHNELVERYNTLKTSVNSARGLYERRAYDAAKRVIDGAQSSLTELDADFRFTAGSYRWSPVVDAPPVERSETWEDVPPLRRGHSAHPVVGFDPPREVPADAPSERWVPSPTPRPAPRRTPGSALRNLRTPDSTEKRQ